MSEPSEQDRHRARYLALREAAAARASSPPVFPPPPVQLAEADRLQHAAIPAGWYWCGRVARWQSLRIANPRGAASVAALFWNAEDTSERFNPGDTMKLQWTARLGLGHLLFSDMGRVLAAITADTAGGHDALAGASTPATDARRYGGAQTRNTRDNFRLGAAKFGLARRDVGPCISFFADIGVDPAGQFVWHGTGPAGGFVDLRAEMNLLVVLSNCPHPLNPAPDYPDAPAEVTVFRSAPPGPRDPCRTAGEEAIRAFQNTDACFAS